MEKRKLTRMMLIGLLLSSCRFGGTGLFEDINQQYESNHVNLFPFFTVDADRGGAPFAVTFHDNSSGKVAQWFWDFDGDGIMDFEGASPAPFVYEHSGEYAPVLTVVGKDKKGRVSKSFTGDLIYVAENTTSGSVAKGNKYPFSIASGDLNGDGFRDIVTTHNFMAGLIWYPNNGKGQFTIGINLTEYDGLGLVALGDLDMDGDLDIVSTTLFPREEITEDDRDEVYTIFVDLFFGRQDRFEECETFIAWWENVDRDHPGSGDGSTWQKHMISTAESMFFYPTTLKTGDVDGDGDLDVFAGARYGLDFSNAFPGYGEFFSEEDILPEKQGKTNKVTWWENKWEESGAWVEHDVVHPGGEVTQVDMKDLNNDGKQDFFLASRDLGEVLWLEKSGPYADDTQPWVSRKVVSLERANAVCAGDFDMNGTMDILITSRPRSDLYLMNNIDGTGETWNCRVIPGYYKGIYNIISSDVDLDGDEDLLISAIENSSIRWLENLTQGDTPAKGEWRNRVISFNYTNAIGILSSDLDNDHFPEVVCSAMEEYESIRWWRLNQ